MLLEVVGKLQAEVEGKPVAEDRLAVEEEGSLIGHLPVKETIQ